MSYYTFDETNFNTFNPANLIFEEGKKDIGTYKVSYFNLKYRNDDGSPCMIKIKTPSLTTPFGANLNQFGKMNITVNIPQSPLHQFLTTLQNSVKKHICDNIKTFNKASTKAKISTDEFDILNTAFDIIKPHKEDTKYDDTIVFDITSEFDQKNLKVFNNDKKLIEGIVFDDEESETYIGKEIPSQSHIRIVFTLKSICMYGETKARKFTFKKSPTQILIVEKPMSNDTCEFSDDEAVSEYSDEEDEDNNQWDD